MNENVSPAEIVNVKVNEQVWVWLCEYDHECLYEFVCKVGS